MKINSLTTYLPKFLINYLNWSGIFIHLLLIVAILFPALILKEPLTFFLERTANYLKYSGGSSKQRNLGGDLIKYLPLNDWSTPRISQIPTLKSLDSWQGQGASAKINYMAQQYNGSIPIQPIRGAYTADQEHLKLVYTSKEFITAITKARPGDTIQLMSGVYNINTRYITIHNSGREDAPITVRSSQLGMVKINLNTSEGFHIHSPYWVFENLEIQGQCNKTNHNYCDHAFHIVGNAHSFVLRNNKIYDFNAQIKVNGSPVNGVLMYPDNGLIEKNSFYNLSRRHTKHPVNSININSVNNWVVRGNLISDFVKTSSSTPVSFGAYMKGNSHNGLFENNLIICEHTIPADRGIRIGLSFGGGGTGQQYCRDNNCDAEHTNGIMRNNIILNCSHDVGIYLNKAQNTKIYNNLLFNNLGIDVRFNSSTAHIYNNIISGRIKQRNGGSYTAENNLIDHDCIAPDREFSNCSFLNWYWDIVNADTSLKHQVKKIQQKGVNTKQKTDFCGFPRKSQTKDIGPIEYSNNSNCSADRFRY